MKTCDREKTLTANERGTALVTTLLFLAILAIMAATAMTANIFELRHSGDFKAKHEASYIADAGIEVAKAKLAADIDASTTLPTLVTTLLTTAAGPNSVLVNSDSAASFTAVDDVPYAQGFLGSGNYKVYITNDRTDGVQNKATDSNWKITFTSVGTTPGGRKSITQAEVGIPMPPGGITFPGKKITFTGGNSNAKSYSGGTNPAIAFAYESGKNDVNSSIDPGKVGQYTGGSITPPSLKVTGTNPPWDTESLKNLYDYLKSIADYTSPSTTGFSLGTSSAPKIVVIDGNFSPSTGGTGILAVNGTLTIPNNFNYDGLVIVIGEGTFTVGGGSTGNSQIKGGIVIANTIDVNGYATFNAGTGGGNLDVEYDPQKISYKMPLKKMSWRKLQ